MNQLSPVDVLQEDSPETSWNSAYGDDLSAYEHLPAGAIRLLGLLPGKAQDDVSCEIVTFDLESAPAYEALSYCWGKSFNLARIVLHGKNKMKRHNLVECLRTIRYEDSTRLVWVDALCINQADSNEKSEQVALMPQIYRSACKTLIWLGGDVHSLARRMMASARPDDKQGALVIEQAPSVSFKLLTELAQNGHIQYTAENAVLAGNLWSVCENAWFERMWVVQETLLSRSANLVLGTTTISWETAFQAAANYVSHAATCCHVDKVEEHSRHFTTGIDRNMKAATQVLLSFQRIPLGTKNELLAHLWMFRNRLVTLSADKIYGILGLLESTNITIEPDYDKPFVDLCCSVTLEDIRLSGNLHALKGVRTKAEAPASWSTDWSSLDYWAEDQSRVLTELYKPIYSASGHHIARVIKQSSPPWAIGVTGQIFDRVVSTSDVLSFPAYRVGIVYRKSFEDALKVLQVLKEVQPTSSYVGGGGVFSAFWKTLMGGHMLPYRESQNIFHNVRSSSQDAYEPTIRRARATDWICFLLWWLCGANGLYLKNHMAPESDPTYFPLTEEDQMVVRVAALLRKLPVVRDINASITRATSGRRLFVTASGYIGLGPEHTQVQDQVAILLGGSTPFMLREVTVPGDLRTWENKYSLLGDCYVHGCMDGEWMKNADVDGWPSLLLV